METNQFLNTHWGLQRLIALLPTIKRHPLLQEETQAIGKHPIMGTMRDTTLMMLQSSAPQPFSRLKSAENSCS